MQKQIKPTGETFTNNTRRNHSDSGPVNRLLKVGDLQRLTIANQGLPFLRGYFPTRGIVHSALND